MFRPRKEAPIPEGIRLFKLELDVFGSEAGRPYSERVLQILLDALTAINTEWLMANPLALTDAAWFRKRPGPSPAEISAWCARHPAKIPPLYQSGVVYTREAVGADERWQDCRTSFLRRHADCEDLATWRAAEYRTVGGEFNGTKYPPGTKARAFPSGRRTPGGSVMYHIRVMLPDGSVEDPSRVLGMNTPAEGEALAFSHKQIPKMRAPKAFLPPGAEQLKIPEHVAVGEDAGFFPLGMIPGIPILGEYDNPPGYIGYSEAEVVVQQRDGMGSGAGYSGPDGEED